MDDIQLILTALSQAPDLVEAARTYKDVNDRAINTISTAVKQQPKAIIPDSEMTRLKNNISQTHVPFQRLMSLPKHLQIRCTKL